MTFTKETALSLVQSDKEFAVEFDAAWQWLEYSKKSHAKESLLKCGFIEGVDYTTLPVKRERVYVEEISLTVDCFKQWAMMSGTPKGKQVRLYFLECERELKAMKTVPVPTDILDVLALAVGEMKRLDTGVKELKATQEDTTKRLASVEARVNTHNSNSDYYSVLAFASLRGVKISKSVALCIGKACARVSKEQGIMIGKVPDERYGSVNSYHTDILVHYFTFYKLLKQTT